MVNVLIYLFENYMASDSFVPIEQHTLEDELSQAGFDNDDIAHALDWLDELARRTASDDCRPARARSLRIHSEAECRKLDPECRGLLLSLEQAGILDAASRELVLERVLAVTQPTVSVEELKWIVLLVLMNRPGSEPAFARMEDLVYGVRPPRCH